MTLHNGFSALFASFRMRLTTITRYPGQVIMDIFIPIVFAYMPILLGPKLWGGCLSQLRRQYGYG